MTDSQDIDTEERRPDFAGSGVSVACLYEQHFGQLVSYLWARFGAGPPEPEDIAHSAFARIASPGQLDEVQHPKAYLWRTASNIAISEFRARSASERMKQAVSVLDGDEGCHLTPERVLLGKAEVSIVVDVLNGMPAKRRQAFYLSCFEGMTHAQVAAKMAITRQAVSKHVAKATEQLFTALDR